MDRETLRNTQNVFEKDYTINESQEDAAGNVTCSTLARFMQDATTEHMNQAGITVDALMAKNLLWVIVFTEGKINRLPKAGETVEQYSWPGAQKFGMHSRRFAFFAKNGEELLNVASLFLLVNKDTRELSEPTKETISLPVVQVEGEPKLPKMMQKFPELIFGKTHSVTEEEIDYNGHVNNAVYLDWADSIFSAGFVKKRTLKNFWVQYDKEVLLDQKVEMDYASGESAVFIKGNVDGTDCFKAKFDY